MSQRTFVTVPGCLLLILPLVVASEIDLPMFGDEQAIASINGEPITLDEFHRELASRHRGFDAPSGTVAMQDPTSVLDEMIKVRLILQEARNIGLDEISDVAQAIDVYRRDTLRDVLMLKQVGLITEPDPEEVERRYRETVGEARMLAAYMEDERDARELQAELERGGDFATLVAELVAAGRASGGDESPFVPLSGLLPAIREVLLELEPGAVSAAVVTGEGYSFVKLLELRVPEDPGARARAKEEALKSKQLRAALGYTDELRERYGRIHQEVLDSVDYTSAENGLESYLDDQRIVAEIEGGEPLTVAQLTERVKGKLFHGKEETIQSGRADTKKHQVLADVVRRRAVLVEARKLGIDRSEEYLEKASAFESRVLFGTFVQKLIDPEIAIEESELQAYLDGHPELYSRPVAMRIGTLALEAREDAENALERLRRGTQFGWLQANIDGLADPDSDEMLKLPDGFVELPTLPEGMATALEGASAGESRLYHDPDALSYVLHVREVREPQPLPLDAVRGDIRARLVQDRRRAAIDDWARKLRDASEIEIYAQGELLRGVLGLGRAPTTH